MWWKLTGLWALAAVLIFAIIPIQTHAIAYEPMNEPAPARGSLSDMINNMHLTPDSVLLILFILAIACFVTLKVARGQW